MKRREQTTKDDTLENLLNEMETYYLHQLEEQRRVFSSFVYDHMVPSDQILSYIS
jgi:hypothetical protein